MIEFHSRKQILPTQYASVSTYNHQLIVSSGVGSNRVLRGPPIQVVGVALITEFYDCNYSFVESYFSNLNQTFMKKV